MKRETVLKRVSDTIRDYKSDESKSKYYIELKKSYKEYESMQIHTKKIDHLYLKHMSDLCDYLDEKRHFKSYVVVSIIMLVFTLACTIYATYGFRNLDKNMVPRIMKNKPNISLKAEYENTHNLMIQSIPSSGNYKDLNPATIRIAAIGDDCNIGYNIYIIPINYDKSKYDLGLYNFAIEDNIVNLSEKELFSNKIKIYSGKMRNNEVKIHDIRMWVNDDILGKYDGFSFQIYVDGYVI